MQNAITKDHSFGGLQSRRDRADSVGIVKISRDQVDAGLLAMIKDLALIAHRHKAAAATAFERIGPPVNVGHMLSDDGGDDLGAAEIINQCFCRI